MPKRLSEDEFNDYIVDLTHNNIDRPDYCFEKLMDLYYPNTNTTIPLEYARCYYEAYAKYAKGVKLDKNFDSNAYAKNKKIFENAHKDYKPKK